MSNTATNHIHVRVPEDSRRLAVFAKPATDADVDAQIAALREDSVVLASNLSLSDADSLISAIAARLDLDADLELQAAMADSLGHRELVSRYYMTVNKRHDYQVVTPHSEGSSFSGLQLASFYCLESSVDGGETILFNVRQDRDVWARIRECRFKGTCDRPLSRGVIAQIRGMHRLDINQDVLEHDDQIVQETATEIPGLTLYHVLAKSRKTYSRILEKELWGYWDTTDTTDWDSVPQFVQILRSEGLLREPPGGLAVDRLDSQLQRRIWRSGVTFDRLFLCKVTRKLVPGDFIAFNNVSWAHSTANWTPNSGQRRIGAAFA